MLIKCKRCEGSGELGVATRGAREKPGPVPDEVRGWRAVACSDCGGIGTVDSAEGAECPADPAG